MYIDIYVHARAVKGRVWLMGTGEAAGGEIARGFFDRPFPRPPHLTLLFIFGYLCDVCYFLYPADGNKRGDFACRWARPSAGYLSLCLAL